MFAAYRNPDRISNMIQNKISNIDENEFLFPNVDYSHAYDDLIEKYSDLFDGSSNSTEETDGDGQSVDGENNSEDTEGTEGAVGTEGAEEGGTAEEETIATEEQMEELREAYEQVEDEQGWLGKAWNGVKNFFGHSNGSDAVEDVLDKAENGEVSYEEAVEKLNTYSQKQGSFVDTFANVTSGLAVALGAVFSPFSFGATLAIGTAAGAAMKVGIKASDKATNDVEGDYKLKDLAKDGITGAVGSAVTVATAGIGSAGINMAKEGGKVAIRQVAVEGAKAGAKAGAIDGGVMGATNYIADAAFDDEEFSIGGLTGATLTGTIGGAATGGVVGGVASGLTALKVNKAAASSQTADGLLDEATGKMTKQAASDASEDSMKLLPDDMFEDASEQIADGLLNKTTGKTTEQAAKQTTAEAGEGLANANVKKTANNTSQENILTGKQRKQVYKSNGKVAKTQVQRNTVLKNKVNNKEILNLQDAYKAGFDESEIRAAGLYNKLEKAGTTSAKVNTFLTKRAKSLASNVQDLANMTPVEMRDAIAGKAGATKQEFVDAYKLLQDTDEYKTNLLFRSVLDKAYDTIDS